MMEEFLECLLAMYRAVEPEIIQTQEPEESLQEGDRKIGILPQDLRKWHAVRNAFFCEHNAIYESIAEALDEKIGKPKEKRFDRYWNSILALGEDKLVTEVWSLGIMMAFPDLIVLPAGYEIIICQGWQIVLRRQKSRKELRVASWGARF